MWSTRRRALLGTVGAGLTSLAGCLSTARDATSGVPRVDNPRLRKMVLHDSGIWGTVRGADGQFLVVDVNGFGDDTYAYPLDVTLDGGRVVPDDPEPFRKTAVVPLDEPPTDPEGFGDHGAAMDVPARRVDEAAVVEPGVLTGGRWELPAAVTDRLHRVPSFDLRAFETDVVDGTLEVTVTVSNDGDRAGRWLGQLTTAASADSSEVFALAVPAGETATRTVRPSLAGIYAGSTVTLELIATTRREREVSVPESTATGTVTTASPGDGTATQSGTPDDRATGTRTPTATPRDRTTHH